MKSLYDNQHEAEMIERLKSLEITPPEGSWDDIQSTLKLKRRRSIVVFSSLASAAAVALFFTISGINFFTKNSNSTNQDLIVVSKSKIERTEGVVKQNKIIDNQNIANSSERESKSNSFMVEAEKIQPVEESKLIVSQLEAPGLIQPKPNKPLRAFPQSQDNISCLKKSKQNYSNLASLSKNDSKRKGEWFISASGFPVYSFHTAGIFKKDGTQNESGMMSWGGSVSVQYNFSKSFSIESGITYSKVGEQEKNLYLASNSLRGPTIVSNGASSSYGVLTLDDDTYKLLDADDANSVSTLVATNFTKVHASQQFKYIEIPILFAKRFYYRGYKFSLKGGFSESILIGNKLNLEGDKISLSGKTAGMDKYSSSAIAAISLSIPLLNRVNLLIEPNARIGLKSLSTSYGKSFPFASYIKFGVEVPL